MTPGGLLVFRLCWGIAGEVAVYYSLRLFNTPPKDASIFKPKTCFLRLADYTGKKAKWEKGLMRSA